MKIFNKSKNTSGNSILTVIGRELSDDGHYRRYHIEGFISTSENGKRIFETVIDELAPDGISEEDFIVACKAAFDDAVEAFS